MFEKALKEKLEKIFDLKRVEFAVPSESQEQDVLFCEITTPRVKVTAGKQSARVTGKIFAFSDQKDMPHGYFTRRIAEAKAADVKDFFFANIDESAGTFRDLDVRSADFTFFYSSQYDPDQGIIESLNLSVEVTE